MVASERPVAPSAWIIFASARRLAQTLVAGYPRLFQERVALPAVVAPVVDPDAVVGDISGLLRLLDRRDAFSWRPRGWQSVVGHRVDLAGRQVAIWTGRVARA